MTATNRPATARDDLRRRDSALVRGLRVLTCIADSGEARASDVAAELGLPLSTVYRYIKTLRNFDLVEECDGSYVPGYRLAELSSDTVYARLVELGHDVLRDVTRITGETSVLAIRSGTSAVCLRQVIAPRDDAVAFRLSQRLPLQRGAGQRVLLAHAPEPIVQLVLDQTAASPRRPAPGRARTLAELQVIRRTAVCISRGELMDQTVAVAVPVHVHGEVVCSLASAGHLPRCSGMWVVRARSALASAATRLGAQLSGARAHALLAQA